MKKILTLVAAVVIAVSTFASPYEHSIGVVGGSGIGLQYKVMPFEHFAVFEEFGYLGSLCSAGRNGFNMATLGAVDNLVLAYEDKATEGQNILLDWFVGGQIKAGYIDMGGAGGIIGIGLAAGIEANMKNAPMAFSFDFRPGYGCVLANGGGTVHVFDWTINLGVRYTIPMGHAGKHK